ncbi:SAM-dependent methyltransferase [Nocardia yunnanensis]|uniref:S-adenosyl-L-methionine-dependent methyltransferase n=1 Tax=Nocardia yunnanensis TaxID=2382165 RepID=A0A386ZB75_9NOCA|nr:class I SAM-dependent methyltransferase [Nocardia yunnanensis]AYF74527.1 SAM-dependent methyltransferase [Nocardia yunnanensis]
MTERAASRTAILVCQGRAVADGRLGVGRFSDPIATHLLVDGEHEVVDRVRAGQAPKAVGARIEYELLCATAEVLAARTVAIDEALREHRNPQLVILGAGLDARAWRMPELAQVAVFEVDHPASQAEKRARLGEREPLTPARFVPVDFGTDALGAALNAAGHDESRPTTWIWEGVVPYLSPAEVSETVTELARRSAPGSRVIATYPTSNRLYSVGRRIMEILLSVTGRTNPMAREPQRSNWTPDTMAAVMTAHGFTVTRDRDKLTVAHDSGVEGRPESFRSTGRLLVADRL